MHDELWSVALLLVQPAQGVFKGLQVGGMVSCYLEGLMKGTSAPACRLISAIVSLSVLTITRPTCSAVRACSNGVDRQRLPETAGCSCWAGSWSLRVQVLELGHYLCQHSYL